MGTIAKDSLNKDIAKEQVDKLLNSNDYGFLVTNNTPDIFSGIPMIYTYNKEDQVIYMKYISQNKGDATLDTRNTKLRLIKLDDQQTQKITYQTVTTQGEISSVVKMKEKNQAVNFLKRKYSDEYIDSIINTADDKDNVHILKLHIENIAYNDATF